MSTYSSLKLRDEGMDKFPATDWWDIATSIIDEPLRICHENAELHLDDENARRVFAALQALFGAPSHESATPARAGWECPKCGAVYAPWVMECKRHRSTQMRGTWVTV